MFATSKAAKEQNRLACRESAKLLVAKKASIIEKEGGYVIGNIKICKKIEHFKLRRPKKGQCWFLESGTSILGRGTKVSDREQKSFTKIKYGILPWQSGYGMAHACGIGKDYMGKCIQTHSFVE